MVNVAVLIPALNEAGSLRGVIAALPADVRCIVIDNGSTDNTASIAVSAGAEVIAEPRRGYGSAVQAGLRHLAADPPDVVVILDADHADDPQRIQRLLEPIVAGDADLVLADRSLTAEAGALTLPQRFGNRLATALIAGISGRHYRDMGPFRALSWSAVQRLDLVDPTWGWNLEMQLKAAQRGLRVLEIPLPYRKRRAGQSKISGSFTGSVRAGYRILWAVNRYRA